MLMGRSAASKLRQKSQREAVELQEQSDATLAMEEEELAMEEEDEIVFKRQRTVPDTPRASRDSTPGPDDREEEHRQFATVLQMVKTVRDQITALVLDNSNIRAACDDLRRQCHSQGVAFGDLSRLVNQSILAWAGRTSPSYQAGVAGRWRQSQGTGHRDLVAGRRNLSSWCPDNGTARCQGRGPSSTGDSGTIPVVSEGSRGRLPPTGDVDTVPTESRTTAGWHVDARVHRDVGHTGTPLRHATPGGTSRP